MMKNQDNIKIAKQLIKIAKFIINQELQKFTGSEINLQNKDLTFYVQSCKDKVFNKYN